ncbi:hypothetical protein JCM16303_002076 [Sporobolomyces ruberrimus]
MASAVIRAMSFGALSSSDDHRGRGDPDTGGSSRSSSKNRFSKTLSRESTLELDDSLGLERSLSRLSLVSSTSRPGNGILINRSRPSSPQPPTARSLSYEAEPFVNKVSSSAGSTSSMTRPGSYDQRTSSDRRPLPPARTQSSTSTVSINEPTTPLSPGFVPLPHPSSSNLPPPPQIVREESVERKPKIKFAPLPQIRPRSYSTGRNVWPEYGEGVDGERGEGDLGGEFAIDDENSGPLGARHLVRREDQQYPDDGLNDEDYDSEEEEEVERKFNPRRQSWTDTLGMGSMGSVWGLNGGSSSNSHKRDKSREIEEDAVSLGSSVGGGGNNSDYGLSSSGGKEKESGGMGKILKPFLFGRKKSISKSSSTTPKASSSSVEENGGGALSRQSSGDSQFSRRSISNDTPGPPTPTNEGTRPKGTTGIPMRKASTWDSTNSGGSKGSSGTTKQKNPNRLSLSTSNSAVPSSSLPRDPSTPQIIYYASPNRASRPARRAQYPPVAQRSRTAPKPIRKSQVEEPEFSEWGSVGSVGSVGSRGGGKSTADEDEDGSGMAWIRRRRKEREEKERRDAELAALQPVTTAEPAEEGQVEKIEVKNPEEDKENEVVQRAMGRNPRRQSTIDSTFSMASSASTIRPASPKIMSGLSLSRPSQAETGIDAAEVSDRDESDDDEEEEEVGNEVEIDNEASEDESDEEEEEAENEEKEDDDDLDAEELAQEEALADAARRTAKGAGAERYHSTTHENVLHVPQDSLKRQPSQQLKRSNSNGSSLA